MHPSYFGPRMLEIIEAKLHSDVQGTCTGQYGFIIAVLEIIDVGMGIVLPGNGQAEFKTRYKAIVFKPFKGEVLDGVVTNVLRVGTNPFTRTVLARTDGGRRAFSLRLARCAASCPNRFALALGA